LTLVVQALFDGFHRVRRAPAILAGVYAMTLLPAVPLTLALHDAIASHLGSSVSAEGMAEGVHWEWWEEFQGGAHGIEQTFTPSIIGFSAVLRNLSGLLDGNELHGTLIAVIVFYLTFWAFLIGGILDRLARQRRVTAFGFFAACGTYFFRFSRLAVLVGLTYWVLVGPLHNWLFDDVYPRLTSDLTVERTGFAIRLGLYAIFVSLLIAVNLLFDYAKIRAVVEDRRSMVGALLAAGRFVRRRPTATVGLYLLNSLVFALVLIAYALTAPAAGVGPGSTWLTLVIGQTYVVTRLFTKLVFYASQTAYFQRQLAHANYVAAPQPVWPESPTAEAIASGSRER
jgi:uncharacterized Tic20 family protein